MSEAYIPKTLDEALAVMKEHRITPLAGGTDLMVQRRIPGKAIPVFERPLLVLNHLEALKRLDFEQEHIVIGAGVLLNDLALNMEIPRLLRETAREMAAVTTRNVATIGGNICNASPAADTLPFLYAVNATLLLQSRDGERRIPVDEFITGPGETARKPDELLVEIHIPRETFDLEYHRKVGTRKAMALSKIAFAGMASFEAGHVRDVRIALGAVAPKTVRSRAVEQELTGLAREEIKQKAKLIRKKYEPFIQPIDDARSSAEYRKAVALDMIEHFVAVQMAEQL